MGSTQLPFMAEQEERAAEDKTAENVTPPVDCLCK